MAVIYIVSDRLYFVSCPFKKEYLSKTAKEKRITVTYYQKEYERNIERIKSEKGRRMKYKRSSTVEPVFGTLTQFMGLRKINTKGLSGANKVMQLAATTYNPSTPLMASLKKYLKFETKRTKIKAKALLFIIWLERRFTDSKWSVLQAPIFS